MSNVTTSTPDVEVLRAEHPDWVSNTYLLINGATRQGVLIDGNGVGRPLIERIQSDGIEVSAVLLTHHHMDHVMIDSYRSFGAPVIAHPDTGPLAGIHVDRTLADGEVLEVAGLRVEALYTPGHANDHISFLIEGAGIFTGDVLFKGTVGGTRAPGGTDLADLRASIERLLALPAETVVQPGHREPTTVAGELAENPFVLAWQAGVEPLHEQVTVAGEPAELLLWGPDYDGTHKAWVRFADGVDHVVGGSQVVRSA
jgi:glyoxylase-like metal-dependent hydrolase (beta-lactamase superfamily II)